MACRCGHRFPRVEVTAFFERANGGDIAGNFLLRGDDFVTDGVDFSARNDVVDDAEAVPGQRFGTAGDRFVAATGGECVGPGAGELGTDSRGIVGLSCQEFAGLAPLALEVVDFGVQVADADLRIGVVHAGVLSLRWTRAA